MQTIDSKVKINCFDDNVNFQLAISKGKGEISIVDMRSQQTIVKEQATRQAIRDIKFSPFNPNDLAICYSDRIAIFDINPLRKKRNMPAHAV